MSEQVLRIGGDASGAKRALGETVAANRQAIAQINAESRRASAKVRADGSAEAAMKRQLQRQEYLDRVRAIRDGQRVEDAARAARDRASRAGVATAARAERDKTRASERESRLRILLGDKEAGRAAKADRDKVKSTERAERDRTRVAAAEGRERQQDETRATRSLAREEHSRTRLAEAEARQRAREGNRIRRQAEREEIADTRRTLRQITNDRRRAEREASSRSRAEGANDRAAFGYGRRVAGALAGGAAGYATTMDGEIQGARARRAPTERAVGSAVYQAGGDRRETQSTLAAITTFAAEQGMDSGEIANALNAAQTEFSTLGNAGSSPAERARRLQGFLGTAELARSTGNDVGEFARLQGLFSQTGFDAATQRQLLLYTGGATQRGAVETGSVTREAMPAITARMGAAMAQARGTTVAGETPQQTAARAQRAAVGAYAQSLSEIEVARGTQGASPREAGNALRNVNGALQGHVTQDKLLTNIRSAQGRHSALESTLYEADPTRHGQRRLRAQYTNALDLVGAFGDAGLSSTQFQNITGGGGHGNPLSVLANQRRLLGNLLNADADADGKTGIQRTRDLMNVSRTTLTDADVARGRGIFGHDTTAELNRNQEQHDNALRNLHPDLVGVSDSITNWKMRHPWLNEGANQGGGVVQNVGGVALDVAKTGIGAGTGTALATGGVRGALSRAGAGLAKIGTTAAGGIGLLPGLAVAGGALVSQALMRFGHGNEALAGVTGRDNAGHALSTGERAGRLGANVAATVFSPITSRIDALLNAINGVPGGTAAALARTQITATVDPHAAQQGSTGEGSSRHMPRTP